MDGKAKKKKKQTYKVALDETIFVYRSRSNNDLLSIDRNNADTASLHSLPMNSSIACLDDLNSNSGDGEGGRANSSSSVNNIGGGSGGIQFDTASFTSSPLASPINASKGKQDKRCLVIGKSVNLFHRDY